MFQVTPNGPNRVDVHFSGKLDSDQMKVALDELVTHTQDIEHGRMLYRIDDFDMPSMGAIGVELKRLPQLYKLMRKFDRVAMLADQGWVRKVSAIEGAMMPGMTLKAFERSSEAEAEAEAWLTSGSLPTDAVGA